ncbi:hypothetical protein CAI21_07440 [Alkalilimnicola ehrlichii]|uniref:Transglycosylase SLT domain-containing protein n=1 Tax=Alkalilimnicola ehrlichii TaxID=351052 RepID=A0A3E0WWK8_9GAMM|nr:hypothetical protein [Alkalilimnicola ehrlichii]RFA30040.1 hypothetical protein CAI21_07440 [Alkalilimnicola ehrlichii]RFA37384.1 hypothetical protein CAL65_08775 [Alkalilimnicola ehrlichii]
MRLSLILLALLMIGGCASTPPSNINNVCDIFAEKPHWQRAAERTERQWGVPVHVQMAIIHQESSFRARARPPRKRFLGIPTVRPSSAYGFAQAKDGTWDWYREQTGRRFARRTRFAHATDFIGWYTDVSARTLGIAKTDARNQYLAYHEGHGGFRRQTYRDKSWLIDVSHRVERNAQRYEQQLRDCQRGRVRRALNPF